MQTTDQNPFSRSLEDLKKELQMNFNKQIVDIEILPGDILHIKISEPTNTINLNPIITVEAVKNMVDVLIGYKNYKYKNLSISTVDDKTIFVKEKSMSTMDSKVG